MKLEEKDIGAALNRRLSALTEDPLRRAKIRQRIAQKEEPRMMKKFSMVLVVMLAVMLMSVTALAASLLISPKLNAVTVANHALEEKYGITLPMQTYFGRQEQEQEDGSVLVTYEGVGHLAYVLGKYTVTVWNGKAVSVAWSHDGESTEGGFEADAWGEKQIQEMLRLNAETGTTFAFDEYVEAINARNGFVYDPQPFTEEEIEAAVQQFDRESAEIQEKAKFTEHEMNQIAKEAVIQVYELTEKQASLLLPDDGLYQYYEEKPCYTTHVFLIQNPIPDDLYSRETFVEKDGTYFVYINVETGVVEELHYDSGLGGNG